MINLIAYLLLALDLLFLAWKSEISSALLSSRDFVCSSLAIMFKTKKGICAGDVAT